MFRGNHPARVDEKGRLKLPAEFKRICDELYGPQFYITSRDGSRAEIYPIKEWEKIEAHLADLAGPEKTRLLIAISRYGATAEMDAQGRLLLPQHLRQKAGLTGDAAVLGMQNHLTVIDEVALDKSLEEHPLTDEDLAVLKIPGL
jgi:MraZ protein